MFNGQRESILARELEKREKKRKIYRVKWNFYSLSNIKQDEATNDMYRTIFKDYCLYFNKENIKATDSIFLFEKAIDVSLVVRFISTTFVAKVIEFMLEFPVQN